MDAWENWRADRLLPSRSDMRLSDVTALMPSLSILEIRSPDEFIVRLAGSAIGTATGMELTGKNYLELTTPEIRPLRSARVWRQAQQPCASLMHNAHQVGGQSEYWLEVLSLPMRPADEDGPLQFLTVVSVVQTGVLLMGEFDSQIAKVADRFVYLDIGAGVPADPILEMSQSGS